MTPQSRPRWQFGLRTVLLAILLCACALHCGPRLWLFYWLSPPDRWAVNKAEAEVRREGLHWRRPIAVNDYGGMYAVVYFHTPQSEVRQQGHRVMLINRRTGHGYTRRSWHSPFSRSAGRLSSHHAPRDAPVRNQPAAA